MKVPFTFRDDEYAEISLGDDECGNEFMRTVANEFFRDNPSCLFVRVYEHAGWFLGFRRDGLSCWSTANDMARADSGPYPARMAYHIRRMPNQYHEVIQYATVQRASLRVFEEVA